MKNIKIYNTAYEIGIRILILLGQSTKELDLQRIIFYDYLMIHYNDVNAAYESLHPDNPYHATELFVRRKLVQDALKLIGQKGLVEVKLSNKGIQYNITSLGINCLSYFESEYFTKLSEYSRLVIEEFNNYSDEELKRYINNNVGQWEDQFEKEALFRGDILEL